MISKHAHRWWCFAQPLWNLLATLLVLVLLPPLVLLAAVSMGLRTLLGWLAQQSARLVLLMLALGLAWALCGCGTAPCLVPTHPLVPAALLIPPAQPVPLTLGSGLLMPGKTTLPMPSLAPPTGPGSSN